VSSELKNHISIFGVCCTRDVFGFHGDTEGGYIIDSCIGGGISPISAVSSPTSEDSELFRDQVLRISTYSNFVKRNSYFNLVKNWMPFLTRKKSDYLVIDMGSMRFPLMQNKSDDKEFFTLNDRKLLEKMVPQCFQGGYREVDILSFDEATYCLYMDKFLDIIKQQYNSSQIILIELQAVQIGITDEYEKVFGYNRKIQETIKMFNLRMEKAYYYVKEKLNGCHYIEFPMNVISNKNHKWKKGVLHYVDEWYDYVYEAINIVTSDIYDYREERKKLDQLKHYYAEMMWKKYREEITGGLLYYQEKTQLYERNMRYKQYYLKLLLGNGNDKIIQFIQKKEITHCAFFGCREPIKYWLQLLKGRVEVDYIIESSIKTYEGIECIKLGDMDLPDVDAIFITDIVNSVLIKSRIRKYETKIPIYAIDEIA